MSAQTLTLEPNPTGTTNTPSNLDVHEMPTPMPGFLDDDGFLGPIFTNPFSYD
jgi:hypothetical protein